MRYLDYAATTPVLPEATDAMVAVLRGDFGNPSSVHAYGRAAREIVEDARDRVASAVGASPAEIVFTGGGTEADNLAIKGAARKLRGNGNHVITTAFEHHAVLDTVEWLGHDEFETTVLPVGPDGLVDPSSVAAAVRPSTILVSVMAVNNEIGTAQPLAEIVRAVKEANHSTLVHTDAVQMLGNLPVNVHELGLDFAAFSAHKFGGPKGVGFLFARSHTPVEALLHGGGHEGGLRSGTLNVPGLAGMGVAAEIAAKEVDHKIERVGGLRTRLWQGIEDSIERVRLNGHPTERVPGTLNVS
ncbi:MAG TPA: cysteine desulfurase family protein, partial [Actinomycetota bacterium]|nr:cysteine desulfurase family protein [Actinomycetota bacterium]